MEIVLIVAVLVVAAAVLYMTVTLSTRTRQSTAPLIDDAYKGVAGQVDTATQDLKRQIHDELQKDREQQRLDGREVQGRLDHLDSQASGMANQVMAELATIGRLVEQLGARQDQMRADLGKLDHRVARLDESVARASQPHAVPAGPGTTPAAGPAIVPGQLYAERVRFFVAGVQLPSVPSRSERRFRIQVERQTGALPGAQPGAPGDPSTLIQRAANDVSFRGQLSQAASEYFATKQGHPVSAVTTERWVTQDAYSETDLVEVCNRISSGLDTIVERPFEKTGTELGCPGRRQRPRPAVARRSSCIRWPSRWARRPCSWRSPAWWSVWRRDSIRSRWLPRKCSPTISSMTSWRDASGKPLARYPRDRRDQRMTGGHCARSPRPPSPARRPPRPRRTCGDLPGRSHPPSSRTPTGGMTARPSEDLVLGNGRGCRPIPRGTFVPW